MTSQTVHRKSFIAITTLAILLFYSPALTTAQTATEGAQTLRDAVKDKVQAELDSIKKSVAKRAFVGSIASKTELVLTLTNHKDQPRTVTVTADTTIKLNGGKEGTPQDLKVGDFLLVMGDVDSQNAMTAKRLLVIKKSAPDTRRSLTGKVTAVTSNSLTVETARKETLTVKTTSSTKYSPKTKFSDIKTGDRVVVVGNTTSVENTLNALRLHLVPGQTTSQNP